MAFDELPGPSKSRVDFETFPGNCCNCGNQSVIALATVAHKQTGALRTGAASEFCGRDSHGNPNWQLQDWWALQKYEGFCSPCWHNEPLQGQRKYSDNQVRYAWRWLIGEIAASGENESLAKGFSRVQLTDDQKDTAIEIVNFEANRIGAKDAIPAQFRI